MELIETGKIVNTHGLLGEVKVVTWTDNPYVLTEFDYFYIDNICYNVDDSRIHKNSLLIKFENINTVEEAQKLRNKVIFADQSWFKLDEGVFFIKDLYNVMVYNLETNEYYGKITDILKTGANDVYEVTDNLGKKRLIPAIEDCVKEIDIEKKIMKIKPLEGLFDL